MKRALRKTLLGAGVVVLVAACGSGTKPTAERKVAIRVATKAAPTPTIEGGTAAYDFVARMAKTQYQVRDLVDATPEQLAEKTKGVLRGSVVSVTAGPNVENLYLQNEYERFALDQMTIDITVIVSAASGGDAKARASGTTVTVRFPIAIARAGSEFSPEAHALQDDLVGSLPKGAQILVFIESVNADGSLLPAIPLGVVLAEPDGSGATSLASPELGRDGAFGESTMGGIAERALAAAASGL